MYVYILWSPEKILLTPTENERVFSPYYQVTV